MTPTKPKRRQSLPRSAHDALRDRSSELMRLELRQLVSDAALLATHCNMKGPQLRGVAKSMGKVAAFYAQMIKERGYV